MIDLWNIAAIGAFGMLLLGKREMPLAFRIAGRLVGKVSGVIQGGRLKMQEMGSGSELAKIQNGIRSNLDDLRTIKSELAGAARFPAGRTGSSHPGSRMLKEQFKVSQAPDGSGVATGSGHYSPLDPLSFHPNEQNFNSQAAQPAAASAGARTETTSSQPGEVGSDLSFNMDAGLRQSIPHKPFQPSGADVSGTPGTAVGNAATVTRPSNRPSPPSNVKSIQSSGGERLQHLAMAEVEFAREGHFVPKTAMAAGGADILNEAITDSLLQERYEQALPRFDEDVPENGGDGEPITSEREK